MPHVTSIGFFEKYILPASIPAATECARNSIVASLGCFSLFLENGMDSFTLCPSWIRLEKYETEKQTVAEIVQGMYYEGYDFEHFCAQSIPTMLAEIAVRVSYFSKRIHEGRRETHGGVHIGFEMDELPDEGFGNGRCLAICVSANLANLGRRSKQLPRLSKACTTKATTSNTSAGIDTRGN